MTIHIRMNDLSFAARLEDKLTFGAGYIPFLTLPIPLFSPFVFSLIRFRNVDAPYGQLSPSLYLGITVVTLGITYLILRKGGTWTFAPSLHQRLSIITTVCCYLTGVLLLVFIGYLIMNPSIRAISQLGIPDVLVGVTIASSYLVVLSASILRQDLADLFGRPQGRIRCINEWKETLRGAQEVGAGGANQVQAYEQLVTQSEALLEELNGAKTNEGERLRSVFEEWLTDFQERSSSVSREAILTGDTENDRLLDQYQTLTWIREQVEIIGGDEAWKNTTQ